MDICKTLENRIPSDDIMSIKQRLVALIEVFDADLVVCFVKCNGAWSAVGLEGKLVDKDWHQNLPVETLQKTLEAQRGIVTVEHLGEVGGTTMSRGT